MRKTAVISLGGSLIAPDGIDTGFLKGFKKVIESHVKKGSRFVIICGGGKTARNYQEAASGAANVRTEDLDWIGIYATRLNALLLRYIFGKNAQDPIIANPNEKIIFRKNIAIAAGWKPGWSTDYDAVLLAKQLKVKEIANMSNIDYVYDRDPKKYKDAKPIRRMSWRQFRLLVGSSWTAGLNAPFDPVAAKEAEKEGLKVAIMGKKLDNLSSYLSQKGFKGTVIK